MMRIRTNRNRITWQAAALCLVLLPAAFALAGSGSLSGPAMNPVTGQSFAVPLTLNTGTDNLGTYSAEVNYDPYVLRLDGVVSGGNTEFGAPLAVNIDNSAGKALFNDVQGSSLASPSGSISAAVLQFTAIGGPGATTPVSLTINSAASVDGAAVPMTSIGTTVQIAAASSATARLVRPVANPQSGASFNVILEVDTRTKPLGGYSVVVQCDPNVFRFDGAASAGNALFGAPLTVNIDNVAGRVRFNDVQAHSDVAPSGILHLAVIQMTAIGNPGHSSPLDLTISTLSDVDGNRFSVSSTGTSLQIANALGQADLWLAPTDTYVNTSDTFAIAVMASTGSPLGAYSIAVGYDATLEILSVGSGDAYGFGAPMSIRIDNSVGQVVFNDVNGSSTSQPNGQFTLATLNCRAVGAVAANVDLALSARTVVDTDGVAMAVTTTGATVHINDPAVTPTPTPTLTPTPTPTPIQRPTIAFGGNLDGKCIAGNRARIGVEVSPPESWHLISSMQFEHRPVGVGSWMPIPAASANHPNPDTTYPYFIHWDVSAMANGTYEVRAIPSYIDGTTDSSPVPITISIASNCGRRERKNPLGEMEAVNPCSFDTVNEIVASDDEGAGNVDLAIPAGALLGDTTCGITFRHPANWLPTLGSLLNLNVYTELLLGNGQTQFAGGARARVVFTYPDDDNDGIIDGTGMPEEYVGIYRFNGTGWTRLSDSTVNTLLNQCSATTPHFSLYAILGGESTTGLHGWNSYR